MRDSRLRSATVTLGVLVVAAVPVAAASLVDVGVEGPSNGFLAASATDDAVASCLDILVGCVPGVAASAMGDAKGGVAATYAGYSNGSYVALSVLGETNSSNIALSGAGSATGGLLVVSAMGDAHCKHTSPCYALSLTGQGSTMGGCAVLTRGGYAAFCGQGASDAAWTFLLS